MWECKNCGEKNNNSSLKCHGLNCNADRAHSAKEIPLKITKEREIKKVYDFCPKCRRDTYWVAVRFKGKNHWRCTVCKKIAVLIGKSKPMPVEPIEIKNDTHVKFET